MKHTKQLDIFDRALKAYSIDGQSDTATVINRSHANAAKDAIFELKNDLLLHYPRDYTIKLRSKAEYSPTDMITILRQLCRFHKRRLLSKQVYVYDAQTCRRVRASQYSLL